MNSFDQSMIEIATRVKEIMQTLGFAISDRGVPAVRSITSNHWTLNGEAVYVAEEHTIYFHLNMANPISNENLEQLIAHEMVHAHQDTSMFVNITTDLTTDAYWEQEFERQAYTVQDIYKGLHLMGPVVRMQYADTLDQLNEVMLKDITETIMKFSRQHAVII